MVSSQQKYFEYLLCARCCVGIGEQGLTRKMSKAHDRVWRGLWGGEARRVVWVVLVILGARKALKAVPSSSFWCWELGAALTQGQFHWEDRPRSQEAAKSLHGCPEERFGP